MGEDNRRRVALGYAAILLAAVLWSLLGVTTRELADLGMPASQMGPWRALIGGGCFLVHVVVNHFVRRKKSGRTLNLDALKKRSLWVIAFAVVGVVIFYASLPLAIEAGGVSLAFVLMYTAPIWVAVGSVSFLGSDVKRNDMVAIGVTVFGVAAVAFSAGGSVNVSLESLGWGLLTGISYASYYLLGRHLFGVVEPTVLYALILPLGGVLLAAIVGLEWPPAGAWPWLIFLGVACTYLPYLAFAYGVTSVPPHRAVVAAMVEPVLAVMLGILIYEEKLGVIGVIGGAAVLTASLAVAVTNSKRDDSPEIETA